MQELLTSGRTKEKITGFVSKAGNTFEAYLKYEDERIQFDFDHPQPSPMTADSQPTPNVEEEAPFVPDNDLLLSGMAEEAVPEPMSFAEQEALFADMEQSKEEDGLPWN